MMFLLHNVLILLLLIAVAINPTDAFISPPQRSLQQQRSIISTPPRQQVFDGATATLQRQQSTNTQLCAAAVPFLLTDISTAYTYSLTHYQLATESATTAVLAGVGDLVAQTLSHHKQKNEEQFAKNIDWKRAQTFVLKGSVSGILWSQWYAFCDPFTLQLAQQVVTTPDGISNIQLLLSILLEQFIWCPILYSLWDIPFPMLLRGDAIETIPQNVRATIAPLLLENAKVWTFANLFIYHIPLQWRVVIVSLTDVVWQSVLSSSIAAVSDDDGAIPAEESGVLEQREAPRRQRQVSILAAQQQQPVKQTL